MHKLHIGISDTEYYTYNHYILQGIRAAFERISDVASVRMIQIGSYLDEMLKNEIDVLVVVGNAANVYWQIPRWKALGVTTVFWSTEDPYQLDDNVRYSEAFDLVFSNDLSCLPVYKGRARHLPLAGVRNAHLCDVRTGESLDNDVLFIGSAWPNRVEAFNKLKAQLGEAVRVKVALPTNPHIPKPQIKDPEIIWNWRTSPGGFARLANRSRVVLTLGRTFSGVSGVVYGSTPPPRIFENGLAGTAQVFVAQSREIDYYYEDGKDLITRPTLTQAVEEIKGLLAEPERRDDMACNMRAATLAHHCYENRAAEILASVRALRKSAGEGSAPLVIIGTGTTTLARKPRLLIVVHNTIDRNPGGGVEVYIDASLRILRQHYDVYLLQPVNSNGSLTLELRRPDGINLQHETRAAFVSEDISQPEVENFLFRTILRNKIDLVHFHHLLYLPLTLPAVARLAGARTIFTAHDYYAVCENFSLISYEHRFCNFLTKSAAFCDLCLHRTRGREVGTQAVRRNAMQRALFHFDKVVFNTPYSQKLFAETYRLTPEQDQIIEMAMPNEHFHSVHKTEKSTLGEDETVRPMKVKIPGNFTREKGAFEILELLDMLRSDPIEFHILGREDSAVAARLDAMNHPHVKRERGYQQADLAQLLSDGDVSINFSIWPETYMISLSEAWSAGLIPIVSNLGAPAERVTPSVDGIMIDANDIGKMVEHLRELAYDVKKREAMRETILHKKIFRVDAHVDSLHALYASLLEGVPAPTDLSTSAERLIFDRQMYVDRAPNNVWYDPRVLWDDSFNGGNIRIVEVTQPPASYPITDLPIVFRHLQTVEVENTKTGPVELVNMTPREGNLSKIYYDLTYRLHVPDGLQNVQNFLVLSTSDAQLVYELDKQTNGDGNLLLSGSVPIVSNLCGISLAAVYHGQIQIYKNVEISPLLSLGQDDVMETMEDEEVSVAVMEAPTSVHTVQGCDRVLHVASDQAQLSVAGWAFDPVSGGIPIEALFEFRDTNGNVMTVIADRKGDETIARYEPIFGFSGVNAQISLAQINQALPEGLTGLELRILQKTSAGCWITSGAFVEIDMSKLMWNDKKKGAGVRKTITEELLAALGSLLEEKGVPADQVKPEAELLAWETDVRLFVDRASRRAKTTQVNMEELLSHFLTKGEDLGDVPMVGFDPTIYREKNPELLGETSLFLHYLKFGRHEGRKSWSEMKESSPEADRIRPYMQKDYYLRQAFGTRGFSGDIAAHYLVYGEINDLRPNDSFDPAYYRSANPDVAHVSGSLFVHYLNFGRAEGRRPSEEAPLYSPHVSKRHVVAPFFDTDYYVKQVPYISQSDVDPICHYFEHGVKNNLIPSPVYEKERQNIPGSSEVERFMRWCSQKTDTRKIQE